MMRLIFRIPALDRHPGHDLAVFLNDLALVVHQDQRVVGRLVGVLFMALAGQREHTPHTRLLAGLGENFGLLARDSGSGLVHLLLVIHDAVRGIFREDHQIHAGQAALHTFHHVGDLAGISEHFLTRMQPRHLVVDDGNTDGVVAARNIAMVHFSISSCGC